MFEFLTSRFEELFYKIKNKGKLSPKDLDDAFREIRLVLLEADVNFKVVKDLLVNLKEKAIGANILESLTPFQQIVKIINEEIIKIFGSSASTLNFSPKAPNIVMIVGLQGSGKTTAAVKMANLMKSKYAKNVGLVAADIYRPAAILQLKDMAKKHEFEVYSEEGKNPVEISTNGVNALRKSLKDVVIIDTAGRLQVDDKMMEELIGIRKAVKPHQIYLVVDAMTGQEAVNIASVFKEKIEYDAIVLTKLDSDTRGGAALSINYIVNKPIRFISTGEKVDDFDIFHPDRMASRILGMGDMLTFIEKTEKVIDEKQARHFEEKMLKNDLDFDDFIIQLQSLKKIGSMDKIVSMLPIPNKGKALKNVNLDDAQLGRIEAIISSMTKEERKKPHIINGSRKKRIAKGSGTNISDVNRLLKQLESTKQMLKQFQGFNKGFKLPFRI
jgi:signal recognition particle subunit SRP54